MSLSQCMQSHTNRQYLVWMKWLDDQWNSPSRTDYYLMSIAFELRRANVKKPSAVKMEHFRLKFENERKKAQPKLTREQAAAFSKAKWLGMMTMPVTVIEVQPPATI